MTDSNTLTLNEWGRIALMYAGGTAQHRVLAGLASGKFVVNPADKLAELEAEMRHQCRPTVATIDASIVEDWADRIKKLREGQS